MASDGFGRWAHGERGQNFASAARARAPDISGPAPPRGKRGTSSRGGEGLALPFEINFVHQTRVRAQACWL